MPGDTARFPSRAVVLAWLLAGLLTVLVRLPARWALAFAPAGVRCEHATGSLWRGGCHDLAIGGVVLESATWQVHPWALLRARLAIDLQVDDPRLAGSAQLELAAGGALVARAVQARLPIDAGFLPVFPRGWSGDLEVALDSVRYANGHPGPLQGVLHARGLRQLHPPLPFGDYQLRFDSPVDARGRQVGHLSDEGGPLALDGQLQLAGDGQYELNGSVAARADASPALAKDLEILGPVDPQGRRPFSLAGSF